MTRDPVETLMQMERESRLRYRGEAGPHLVRWIANTSEFVPYDAQKLADRVQYCAGAKAPLLLEDSNLLRSEPPRTVQRPLFLHSVEKD